MKKRGKRIRTQRDPNVFMRVLCGSKTMDIDQQLDLGLAYRLSFHAMRTGTASEDDFHTIACSLNIALILAERGFGEDWIEAVKSAQEGLMRCLIRGSKTGSWGLDGPAMTAITDGLALHDEQIKLASQKDLREAINEVHKRIAGGDILTLEKA